MKLEVRSQSAVHHVEIVPARSEDLFKVTFRPDGGSDDTMTVELLSHNKGRLTLRLGRRIADLLVTADSDETTVEWQNRVWKFEVLDPRRLLLHKSGTEHAGVAYVKSQMPGKVIEVLKQEGEQVESGEGLVIIESMKMQNEVTSPKSGTISRCSISQGDNLNAGELLFEIE